MTQPGRLDRAFIAISGPDARSFLNNLLTQDLAPLVSASDASSFVRALRAPNAVAVLYGALLSPQGKVICDMLIWPQLNGVVLDVDPSRSADLLRRLTMYKLRAQVEISDSTIATMRVWSPTEFQNGVRDPRLSALGWIKLAARDAAESFDEAYRAQRIALGVPDLAHDAQPEEVFAGEALLEELHGVDFQKGCFVGQENVSRMKRRATTRKKFCPIVFNDEAPAPGAAIVAGAAEIGTVRTGAPGRAIALVRLDRALGAELTVDGRPVQLDPPPWLVLPQGEQG